jgi:hypothetical protein
MKRREWGEKFESLLWQLHGNPGRKLPNITESYRMQNNFFTFPTTSGMSFFSAPWREMRDREIP